MGAGGGGGGSGGAGGGGGGVGVGVGPVLGRSLTTNCSVAALGLARASLRCGCVASIGACTVTHMCYSSTNCHSHSRRCCSLLTARR